MWRGGRHYQNGTGEETHWHSNTNSRPAWRRSIAAAAAAQKKDEDGGKIVQRGTHDELIQEDGIYADFVGGKKDRRSNIRFIKHYFPQALSLIHI